MYYILKSIEILSTALVFYFSIINTLVFPFNKIQKIKLFVFILLSYLFSYTVYQNVTVLFLLLFGGSFLFIALFQKHIILNICSAIIGYTSTVCLNYLIVMLLHLFHITVFTIEENIIYTVGFNIIFCLLTYVQTYYLGKALRFVIIKKFNTFSSVFQNPKIRNLFFLELFACLIIFIFNIIYERIAGYPDSIIAFNGLLFLFFFLFSGIILYFLIATIQKDVDLSAKLKEYDTLQEYTSQIEKLYMEIRTFKHDYINLLSTLHVFLEEKQYDKLEEYYKTTILPTGKNLAKEDAILGRISHMKLLDIKGLLYTKIIFALNQNLTLTVDMAEDIFQIPVASADLVRILGVFLDNAIEASVSSDSKLLNIGFYQNADSTIIHISNSCPVRPDLDCIFELGFSTKSDSRGVGLYNARKLLDRYPHILLQTTYENEIFTQELQVLS